MCQEVTTSSDVRCLRLEEKINYAISILEEIRSELKRIKRDRNKDEIIQNKIHLWLETTENLKNSMSEET